MIFLRFPSKEIPELDTHIPRSPPFHLSYLTLGTFTLAQHPLLQRYSIEPYEQYHSTLPSSARSSSSLTCAATSPS